MNNAKKIIGLAWLNGGQVGVVKVENEIGKDKYRFYVKGFCNRCIPDHARNEQVDAMKTAYWGNSLPSIVGEIIISECGKPVNIRI